MVQPTKSSSDGPASSQHANVSGTGLPPRRHTLGPNSISATPASSARHCQRVRQPADFTPPSDLTVLDTGTKPRFSNSALIPVRWNPDDGAPYEWWETPEFLNVVDRAPARSQTAIH